MIDGEATVKRFFRERNRVRLQPENREMAPIYANDVEIIGRVEAVVRRLYGSSSRRLPRSFLVRTLTPYR